MTNVKELLKNVEAARLESQLNPSEHPANVQSGIEMRKMRGQENFFALTNQYRKWIQEEGGAAIILKGTPEAQKAWAKLAESVGNTVTVNAREFYDKLCEGFWAAQGGRGVVGFDEVVAVQRRLDDVMRKLGVTRYVTPALGTLFQYRFENEAGIADKVREIIRTAGGDSHNAAYLKGEIFKAAFEAKKDDPVVPVVVLNAIEGEDKALADRLFGSRSIVVEVKEEPTEKDVIATFKQLKSILKKTKETTKEINNG